MLQFTVLSDEFENMNAIYALFARFFDITLRQYGLNDCPDLLVRDLSSHSETCRECKRISYL